MNNIDELLKKTKLFWQYPVITEETFYNQNKNEPLYFAFPWATVIDKKIDINAIYNLLNPYIKNKKYYTCCQHIFFRKLIPLFEKLEITTVYAPHKIINEDYIRNIQILPCPLYAVNIEDITRNKIFENKDYLSMDRKILYSFIGGVESCYISDIRNNIFKIKHNNTNTRIIHTGTWHFKQLVYSNKQNCNKEVNNDKKHMIKTNIYNQTLLESKYSLCPSGSGPNSIRFWESLAIGAIPVLLANTLDLPKNIDWNKAIVKIKESDIFNIESILINIPVEKEIKMRENCIKIYNMLKNNYRNII